MHATSKIIYYTSSGTKEYYNYKQNNHIPEFYIDKYHGKYDILNQYTIKDTAQLILSFIVKCLHVGDLVDVLDTVNIWYMSYIKDIKNNKIFIQYLGWMNRWNEWIDISSDRIRLSGQMTPGVYRNVYHNNYHMNCNYKKCISHNIINIYSSFIIIHFVQQNKQICSNIYSRKYLNTIIIKKHRFNSKLAYGYYHLTENFIIKVKYEYKII